MTNIRFSFHISEDGESFPVGFDHLTVYLIFDAKMDLTQNERLVACSHKTPDPVGSMSAGFISRELVCIDLKYTALMGLDV